jgi:hypothetical protein
MADERRAPARASCHQEMLVGAICLMATVLSPKCLNARILGKLGCFVVAPSVHSPPTDALSRHRMQLVEYVPAAHRPRQVIRRETVTSRSPWNEHRRSFT